MIFLFSLGVVVWALYILAVQLTFQDALTRDQLRFAYAVLRDRLGRLAAEGKIAVDGEEFRRLLHAIDFHYDAVDTASLMRVACSLARYHTSVTEDRQVRSLVGRVDSEELKMLVIDFLKTSKTLLRRSSRAHIAAFEFLEKHRIHTPRTALTLDLANRKMALERIERNMGDLTRSLHALG